MSIGNNVILSFDIKVEGEVQGTRRFTGTELPDGNLTIGSGNNAGLRIEDESVGELHAAIQLSDGKLMLLDLGTEGGTELNGEAINNGALSDGATIKLGNVELSFSLIQPEPMAVEEEEEVEEATQEVMEFVLASGTAETDLGVDRKKPRVLEVNQIFGDTVVDVLHLGKDETEPVTLGDEAPKGGLPFAAVFGGICLTGSIWFGISASMLVQELMAQAVGGSTVPNPSDFLSNPDVSGQASLSVYFAIAGVFAYLVGWIVEHKMQRKSQTFLVDSELLPGQQFPLLQRDGSGATVRFAEGWSGWVERGDSRHELADLMQSGDAKQAGGAYSYSLSDGERALVDTGSISFFIHEVAAAKPVVSKWTDDFDFAFTGLFLLMSFLGLLFGVWIYQADYDPSQQVVEIPDRFVDLLVQEPEREKVKRPEPSGNPDAGEGEKAKEEQGKVGKEDSKVKRAKGTKVAIQQSELDKEIAESAGLLAELNQFSDNRAFGMGGLEEGISNALGGVIGTQYGTQFGSGGLGSGGTGLGGGGSAEGLGGLGTSGRGSGASGYGRGGGYLGKRGGGTPGVSSGDPVILGALDKSEIDRVVKAHLAQIRYCYQRELNKNPDLYGKVVIKFVISADGRVARAETKTTTLNNALVEQCICERFRRFQFPQPRGGGIVIVSYPFVFNANQ